MLKIEKTFDYTIKVDYADLSSLHSILQEVVENRSLSLTSLEDAKKFKQLIKTSLLNE